MDSDLMDQNESLFPLEVLYADQAILCRDVQWCEIEDVLQCASVGKRFQYQGRMRETLSEDVVGYLMDLRGVSQFCLVLLILHVFGVSLISVLCLPVASHDAAGTASRASYTPFASQYRSSFRVFICVGEFQQEVLQGLPGSPGFSHLPRLQCWLWGGKSQGEDSAVLR